MILLELFYTFFKIGLFTFGGGYAMLPLIQSEVVRHGWMSMEDLINFIAVSESTPGPFAINISTYIGAQTGGVLGSACAVLGVVLPSFIIILAVSKFYLKFRSSRSVIGVMNGLKPAVIGLMGSAVVSVAGNVFFPEKLSFSHILSYEFICSAVIFAAAVFMSQKKIHPILVIAVSATAGIGLGYAHALF